MEYLMTYGQAILIILIAVGALFYLGVFSPSTPSTCQMQAPFVCKDVKVTATSTFNIISIVIGSTGTSEVKYGNIAGEYAITVNGVQSYLITNDGDGNGDGKAENLANGQIVTIEGYDMFYSNLNVGDKYSGTITLSYKKTNSDVTHEVIGQFSGTVEEGTV